MSVANLVETRQAAMIDDAGTPGITRPSRVYVCVATSRLNIYPFGIAGESCDEGIDFALTEFLDASRFGGAELNRASQIVFDVDFRQAEFVNGIVDSLDVGRVDGRSSTRRLVPDPELYVSAPAYLPKLAIREFPRFSERPHGDCVADSVRFVVVDNAIIPNA